MTDINPLQFNQILEAQNKALALLFTDASLTDCLTQMCSLLESTLGNNNGLAAISLTKDNHLCHSVSPRLSQDCVQEIQCAQQQSDHATTQAIFNRTMVFTPRILDHEHWPNTLETLSKHGIQACASWPILCQEQRVLGSLDLYFSSTKTPSDFESAITQHFAQFAAATIEKHQTQEQQSSLMQSIQENNQRMLAISQLIPDLMFVLSCDGTIEDLFGGNHSLLLMAQSEFMGKKHHEVLPQDVSAQVDFGMERALASNEIQIIHYSLNLPIGTTDFEGRIIPAEDNPLTQKQRLLYMARDVTQQNKDKAKIEQLAYYDPLTQLANRSLLLDKLEEKIQVAAENQLHGALIFVDLDDFKKINDSLGHSIGDEFLIMVGLRLKQCIPPLATLSRIGGDEFVILLDDLSHMKAEIQGHATQLSQQLIQSINKSFYYNKVAYQIGCSLGICVFDGVQAATADQVLQQADMCMYQAKKMGGEQLVVYSKQLTDFTAQRFKIESDIQKGIQNNTFQAYFQPQFNPQGQVISAEALIRWHIDGQTHAQPAEFIPIAENSGLINQLQVIILEQSCQLMQQIDCLLGHQDFTLSINISANQLRTKLGQLLLETILQYGLEPSRFKLEITESVLLERSNLVTEQVDVLQSMGFQFSIDDFGMGYSSLAYLHDLPVDELKIDKAFIDPSGNTDKQRPIIQAITDMANELTLDVIIEGVETEKQNQMLQGLHYTALQGFLFSKPLPASAFIQLIKSQSDTP